MDQNKIDEIIKTIKAIRDKRGISQREMARRMGVHPSVYNRFENGTRTPNTGTIVKIADILGVDPAELLGRYSAEFNRLWDTFQHLSPERQRRVLEFAEEQGLLAEISVSGPHLESAK